jgi:hypothetical protein
VGINPGPLGPKPGALGPKPCPFGPNPGVLGPNPGLLSPNPGPLGPNPSPLDPNPWVDPNPLNELGFKGLFGLKPLDELGDVHPEGFPNPFEWFDRLEGPEVHPLGGVIELEGHEEPIPLPLFGTNPLFKLEGPLVNLLTWS